MRYVRFRIRGGGLQESVHAVRDNTMTTLCGSGLGYNGPDVFTEDTPTCYRCTEVFRVENPLRLNFPSSAQKAYQMIMSTLPPKLRSEVKSWMIPTLYGGGPEKLAKVTEDEFDEHFASIKKIIDEVYPKVE